MSLDVFQDDMFDDEQPSKEDLVKNGFEGSIPVLENGWGTFGDFKLVGNGVVTNPDTCGKFRTLIGCVNVNGHNKTALDGVNHAGHVYYYGLFSYCDKPSCPICYKKGWAVREAGMIKARLDEASKHYGQVEHLVISVPAKDYGLEFNKLRKKVGKILSKRGVIGGSLIFHGFRYNSKTVRKNGEVRYMGWYWSPHFHVLGFILGGYTRCRNCKNKSSCIKGCGNFDDRNYWDGFMKDGYYLKVFGKRKTVFGTALYQLNHSSYKVNVKRFHVATWFGACSYRKLKVTPELRKFLCPICEHELVKISYLGSKSLNLKAKHGGFADYKEDGKIVFVEKVSERNKVAVAKKGSAVNGVNISSSYVYVEFQRSRHWGGDSCDC